MGSRTGLFVTVMRKKTGGAEQNPSLSKQNGEGFFAQVLSLLVLALMALFGMIAGIAMKNAGGGAVKDKH